MIDILFVLLFFIFPIIIYYILKSNNLDIFTVSIPSFIIISMFLFSYIGFFLLYFGLDSYRVSIGITNKYQVLYAYLFSAWTIFSLSLGFLFSTKVLKIKLYTYFQIRSFHKKERIFSIFILMFCFLVLFLYLIQLQDIALLTAIFDSLSEAHKARSLMGNDFSGYHRYRWIMRDLFMIITLTLFSNWLLTKNKKDFLIFFISFFGVTFSLLMAIEKGPFAWFIVGMFLVYCVVKYKSTIPVKKVLYLIFLIIGLLLIFYIFFMGSRDIFTAFSTMFSRIFAGGITPAYFYLEFFPSQHDFLYGRSFPNPGGILPFTPYNLTIEVSNYMFPEQIKQGIVGTAPTVFWGELYANFGLIGTIVFPFVVGVMIYVFTALFDKLENTPYKIGFLGWLLLHYRNLSVSGISEFLIDTTLILMIIISIVFISASNNLKVKYYK